MKKVPFSSQSGDFRSEKQQISERPSTGSKVGKPQSGEARSMAKQKADRAKMKAQATVEADGENMKDAMPSSPIKSTEDLRKIFKMKFGAEDQADEMDEENEPYAEEMMEEAGLTKEGMTEPGKKRKKTLPAGMKVAKMAM